MALSTSGQDFIGNSVYDTCDILGTQMLCKTKGCPEKGGGALAAATVFGHPLGAEFLRVSLSLSELAGLV